MNQGLEQEELTKKLDLLKVSITSPKQQVHANCLIKCILFMFQESYSILSSVEERRLYDWSLARNENPDRYAWPFEVDITQTINSPDTPPPQVIFDFMYSLDEILAI